MTRHVYDAGGDNITTFSHQDDLPVFNAKGAGLNEAFVVDHRVEQAVAPFGGEVDRTAISLDEAFVFGQGVECGFVHLDGQQRGVVQAQAHVAPCS